MENEMILRIFGILSMMNERIEKLSQEVNRPHGEWNYDMFDENYHCSECNRVGATIYPFCPNCGADMREGDEK